MAKPGPNQTAAQRVHSSAQMRWYYKNHERVLAERKARRAKDPQPHRSYRRGLQRRARTLIDQLKSMPCADCGGTFDPVCMDFDHRPGTAKRRAVGKMAGKFSEAAILAEIAKCDVVCANCHRLRTKTRATGGI